MNKKEAIDIFGSAKELALALGSSRSAISHIPENLPQKKADEVIGAAIRLGLSVPGLEYKAV